LQLSIIDVSKTHALDPPDALELLDAPDELEVVEEPEELEVDELEVPPPVPPVPVVPDPDPHAASTTAALTNHGQVSARFFHRI
jgi:hypothetical protein